MRYRRLDARHFRRFEQLGLELHPRLTVIAGPNAAGKTSILEALYVAARGESHRSPTTDLPSEKHSAFLIDVRTSAGGYDPGDRIRVEYLNRRIGVQINDQPVGLSELVRKMPVLMLDPRSHQLLEEGPGVRRKFVDWGVFHMEQTFHPTWKRFNRALKQRNSALRAGAEEREINSWNAELVVTAELITRQRQLWTERLQRVVPSFWSELVDEHGWTLGISRGWRDDESYDQTLARTLAGDRALGHTREGPHRAELRILSDNSPLKERISRGQQKLLVAGLMLAQAEVYRQDHGDAPVILVDDFSAELSLQSQARLISQLEAWSGQIIVTALDYQPVLKSVADHAVFHVEHGKFI